MRTSLIVILSCWACCAALTIEANPDLKQRILQNLSSVQKADSQLTFKVQEQPIKTDIDFNVFAEVTCFKQGQFVFKKIVNQNGPSKRVAYNRLSISIAYLIKQSLKFHQVCSTAELNRLWCAIEVDKHAMHNNVLKTNLIYFLTQGRHLAHVHTHITRISLSKHQFKNWYDKRNKRQLVKSYFYLQVFGKSGLLYHTNVQSQGEAYKKDFAQLRAAIGFASSTAGRIRHKIRKGFSSR